MSHRLLQLGHLETFLSVVRTGSLTAAATDVSLTQSAVSRQMKELGTCLGTVLLERFGRGVHLTASGRALVPEAERILLQAEEIQRTIQEIELGELGEFRVGATVSAANYILPEILTEFRKQNAGLRLTLHPTSSQKLLAMIRRNALDIAIVDAVPEVSDLKTWGTIQDDIVIVGPPDHGWTEKLRIRPRDIADQDWVLREKDSGTRIRLDDWARRKGISLNVLMDMW